MSSILNPSKYILQLQLLIARAGQNDSLRWWEDDSLTEAGAYLLERLFPFAPQNQAMKLALQAAKKRHDGVLGQNAQVVHLFNINLDGDRIQDKLVADTLDFEPPETPIQTIDELRMLLTGLIESPPPKLGGSPANNGERLLIKVPSEISAIDMANQLSWGYLQAAPGKPVFPYFRHE